MAKHPMLAALEASGKKLRVVDDTARLLDGGAVPRFDDWQNDVTGLGTDRDKTTFNQFGGTITLNEQELANLYLGNDLAARAVDIVPDEMLREGFDVGLGDADLDAQLAEKIETLSVDSKLANGIRWGRLFGGGGLLLGCDDGRSAAAPLVPERAQALSYIYEFDRRYMWPLTWYREAGPKFGQPETYMVTSPSAQADVPVSVVHESRLILFGGATTSLREKQANFGWDISILQRAYEVLGDFGMGWRAVAVLLADGNQAVFKMGGLAQAIASGSEASLTARYREMDKARSILRAIVIDAGDSDKNGSNPESYERHVFPMTGIPDTLDKMMLRLSAALRIPVTILMGQSPAGMNATGESDFRWFYDQIKSEQRRSLVPRIRRLVKVILATREFSATAEHLSIKFPPLWTQPPLETAQTRKLIADTDAVRIGTGELLPEEVALHRAQPDGYDRDIVLSDAGRKVREAVLTDELHKLEPDAAVGNVPKIEIAPTDVATVMTVNEARASQGLGKLPGPDGELTVSQFKAQGEAQGAAEGATAGGADPNPKPAFGAPVLPAVIPDGPPEKPILPSGEDPQAPAAQ